MNEYAECEMVIILWWGWLDLGTRLKTRRGISYEDGCLHFKLMISTAYHLHDVAWSVLNMILILIALKLAGIYFFVYVA